MTTQTNSQDLQKKDETPEKEVPISKQAASDPERELRKFRGLYDLAIAMTKDQNLAGNLQVIVDKSKELLGSDIAYIALQDESRGEFYKHSMAGIQSEDFKNLRLPLDKGLGGLVARTRQGYIVEDYFAEKRFDRFIDTVVAGEGVVSGMAVPIQMGLRLLGVLYVFNRRKTGFTQSDLDTLFLIGNLAAVEITRKQAEESLRESEERFRFMAETTGDVIYRLRYDSMTYDYLSPGVMKLTGYSAEEIGSGQFSKFVLRIDIPGQENVSPRSIARSRIEGKTGEFRADYLIRTKSGDFKWIRDHSFPWLDKSGRLVGSVGILSDISDYKRAEAQVRERTAELIESEEKYRTLVENVPLVVYRMRPGGEVLFLNQFVEEVLGFSAVEIFRNPQLWSDRVHEEDRSRVLELREKSYLEARELIAEYRFIHKDGYVVHVLDQATPFHTSDGFISSMDGILIDVTGKVKMQQELVRTEGLKTINQVSARLAHEIRNPLVSAGGFARRLFSSMSPDDPNRAKAEIIVKEVGRLEAILKMILNYMQPLDLHMMRTDLNRMIEKALQTVAAEIEERGIRLNTRFNDGMPAAAVDLHCMEKVFETLLKNALGQMPAASTLSIITSREEDAFVMVMQYPVEHLSRDDVEHFFYPFTTFQMVHDTVDLPMSKIIVNKHGGIVDVSMEEPGRLLIRLCLPL